MSYLTLYNLYWCLPFLFSQTQEWTKWCIWKFPHMCLHVLFWIFLLTSDLITLGQRSWLAWSRLLKSLQHSIYGQRFLEVTLILENNKKMLGTGDSVYELKHVKTIKNKKVLKNTHSILFAIIIWHPFMPISYFSD